MSKISNAETVRGMISATDTFPIMCNTRSGRLSQKVPNKVVKFLEEYRKSPIFK